MTPRTTARSGRHVVVRTIERPDQPTAEGDHRSSTYSLGLCRRG